MASSIVLVSPQMCWTYAIERETGVGSTDVFEERFSKTRTMIHVHASRGGIL